MGGRTVAVSLSGYVPFDQYRTILALQKDLPHATTFIKEVFHQAEPQVPLQCTGKQPALGFLALAQERETIEELREWHAQVKQLLVEQRD